MSLPHTRQQKRALERFAAGVDHITAEDRRWFEQHPGRRFRIRRMAAAEIGTAEAAGGLNPLPAGAARFTLVRKVTPNLRTRIFIHGPAHKSGAEASEELAAALWDTHLDRSPSAQRTERMLAAAMMAQDHHQGGAA